MPGPSAHAAPSDADFKPSPLGESLVGSLAGIIGSQAFFNGLSLQQLRTLAGCAMEIQFAEGALIFREGDLANRFYLLLSGEVVLEASIEKGETVPLQIIGPGELLGWSWLFSPYVWHLHARAIEPGHAIFFYGTRLRDLCESDHDLGYEIFQRISQVMMQRLQTARRLLLEGHKAAARDWQPRSRGSCSPINLRRHTCP